MFGVEKKFSLRGKKRALDSRDVGVRMRTKNCPQTQVIEQKRKETSREWKWQQNKEWKEKDNRVTFVIHCLCPFSVCVMCVLLFVQWEERQKDIRQKDRQQMEENDREGQKEWTVSVTKGKKRKEIQWKMKGQTKGNLTDSGYDSQEKHNLLPRFQWQKGWKEVMTEKVSREERRVEEKQWWRLTVDFKLESIFDAWVWYQSIFRSTGQLFSLIISRWSQHQSTSRCITINRYLVLDSFEGFVSLEPGNRCRRTRSWGFTNNFHGFFCREGWCFVLNLNRKGSDCKKKQRNKIKKVRDEGSLTKHVLCKSFFFPLSYFLYKNKETKGNTLRDKNH